MASLKYQCNNCEPKHPFEGDKFTSECPVCKSENIEQLKDDPFGIYLKYLQDNWKIILPIFLGIIILLYIINIPPPPDEKKYIVQITQPDNLPYLEVTITTKKQDEETNKFKTVKIEPNKILSIIDNKIIVNGRQVEIQDGNRIYLCEYDTAKVSIKIKPRVDKELNDTTFITYFTLLNQAASDKASCLTPPLSSSEIFVDILSNCKLFVRVKRNLNGKSVMVSINGKDGDYKEQTLWERKDIVIQDVWVYIKGEDPSTASAATGHGNPISQAGCVVIDRTQFIAQFKILASNYGNDPTNSVAQTAFQNFVNSKFITTKIRLNKLNVDLSELQNKIRVMALNDEDKKFKLQGEPIISNGGSEISFAFIEY